MAGEPNRTSFGAFVTDIQKKDNPFKRCGRYPNGLCREHRISPHARKNFQSGNRLCSFHLLATPTSQSRSMFVILAGLKRFIRYRHKRKQIWALPKRTGDECIESGVLDQLTKNISDLTDAIRNISRGGTMNPNLALEIVDFAVSLVKTQASGKVQQDANLAGVLLQIIEKAVQAYQHHTGETRDRP